MRNHKNITNNKKRRNIRHLTNIYVFTMNGNNLTYPKKGEDFQIINSNKQHV